MTNNLGNLDRVLRIAVGLAALGSPLAWYGLENMTSWGFLGLVPLVTGIMGYCPVYQAFGLDTAGRRTTP